MPHVSRTETPFAPLSTNLRGHTRYAVTMGAFRDQLRHIKENGLKGVSIGTSLRAGETQRRVAITFDDGHDTDLVAAAPLLAEFEFGATFYVVAGFVGRPCYLDKTQLRKLVNLGFEIGCHSMTHAFLSDLGEDGLRTEICEAKHLLEDYVGRSVAHLSCPGGRWSRRVASMAQEAGFLTVSTSRVGANAPGADPFRLARTAVMADTTLAQFGRVVNGHGLVVRRAREYALSAAKRVLGNAMYERFRSAALSGPSRFP